MTFCKNSDFAKNGRNYLGFLGTVGRGFGEGPREIWGRSPGDLGKVPGRFGKGPREIWGRSLGDLGKVGKQTGDLPRGKYHGGCSD